MAELCILVHPRILTKLLLASRTPNRVLISLKKRFQNASAQPSPVIWMFRKREEKKIIRVIIPRGDDPPDAVEDNKIYVRSEAETGLAVRDEKMSVLSSEGNHARFPLSANHVAELLGNSS
jgi:hypothetical protein